MTHMGNDTKKKMFELLCPLRAKQMTDMGNDTEKKMFELLCPLPG